MKTKTIISVIIFVSIFLTTKSQILLEQSYVDNQGLSIIELENSGKKYLQYDLSNQILRLYNLDHSIFKTINIPSLLPTNQNISICYITENLFNTDNLIEILCRKNQWSPTGSNANGSIKIINENGNVLFSADSMLAVEQRSTTYFGYNDKSSFIYNTLNGTKMILYSCQISNKGFKVYSLPGTLPCDACDGQLAGIIKNNSSTFEISKPYPNPSSSEIIIPYILSKNDIEGKIEIFDINGKILRVFNVDNTFNNLVIDTKEFSAGTYYYSLTSASGVTASQKIIVIK
jgi:hypothetical protein